MKIGELKQTIRNYSPEQLAFLVTELYRAIPKSIRDEKHLDALVQNPDPSAVKQRRIAQTRSELSFDEVEYETRQFIEDAYNQYYFAPNRIIHKSQRPKWRFILKRLYNSLLQLASEPEYRQPATELVAQLYALLCRACQVVLFNAYDPFQSVGIGQCDFFRQVLALKNGYMEKKEFLREAIASCIDSGLDRNTTHTDLIFVVLEFLPIPDLKYLAISVAEELRLSFQKENQKEKTWNTQRKLNHLIEFVCHCYTRMDEYEEAIKYFNQHYQEKDEEIKLYCLVQLLCAHCRRVELIAEQIKKAEAQGIRPRKGLIELKNYIMKNKRLPEYLP